MSARKHELVRKHEALVKALEKSLPTLNPEERRGAENTVLTHLLGLTGSSEGKSIILFSQHILAFIVLYTSEVPELAKIAVNCFINLVTEEQGAKTVLGIDVSHKTESRLSKINVIEHAIEEISNCDCHTAGSWAMFLSNMSRVETISEKMLNHLLENDKFALRNLVAAFVNVNYNNRSENLQYLGPIFCNLTQSARGREAFCDQKQNFLEKVLPFASYKESSIRRHGIIGIIKNICFDPKYHNLILRENDDILSGLLYPLMGAEEFTDAEYDMFPIQLQYFGEEKLREESADIRNTVLETLFQLCSMKESRQVLRSKGVYNILREYHKWENIIGKDNNALLMCENVIGILIRDEEEIGVDNIKDVEIPEDIRNNLSIEDKQ